MEGTQGDRSHHPGDDLDRLPVPGPQSNRTAAFLCPDRPRLAAETEPKGGTTTTIAYSD
jgi:hypothetical protein